MRSDPAHISSCDIRLNVSSYPLSSEINTLTENRPVDRVDIGVARNILAYNMKRYVATMLQGEFLNFSR